jgi:transposase
MPPRITNEIRNTAHILKAQSHSLSKISQLLKLSRNTVRRILSEPDGQVAPRAPRDAQILALLEDAYQRARGNVVRAQQLLLEEHNLNVPYSTLTRWVRDAELRAPPRRSGEYHHPAGAEMQHDTSPHRFDLSGKPVKAQCASLVLAYSRWLFFQYYPKFSRFEAKHFLLEACRCMEGTAPICVIDNTSVIVASGTGKHAIMAPEIAAFAATLGFVFLAHERGHSDRKGRIERPFSYIERNFLPGRHFTDFEDVNRQALAWCREVANRKPKAVLGDVAPEAIYLTEKPYLQPLPRILPPVYEVLERTVDLYGYISIETNRYSTPERLVGKSVTAYKYPTEIRIYRHDKEIACHPRLIGQRQGRHKLPGHHSIPTRESRGPALEEQLLKGHHPSLDRYAAALKQHAAHRAARALQRLLELKRTYPSGPFLAAIDQAMQFGLFDLGRLETLILKHVAGDFFKLDDGTDDDA